ncbi:nitroreductase family protein [Papillibacter cinnamivorans]|uniref:Nitroreductase n=1 Tax=Papillibacter cinnamivorans DSM 12816 TaxID=1122930 RepID=A0A1W2CAQ1_9FIRM|nr:nitroreductase family protein [Papillibacter cinnamivorans]SMC81942.1 Nitroreductase [Papillibacter cinnamivorans DSM 12816]
MEALEAIEKRRSIRRYKDLPLSDEQIRALLDAARLAPSGTNLQPWRFAVATEKKTKEKLQELCYNQRFVSAAGAVLVCCADLTAYTQRMRPRLEELVEAGVMSREAMENYSQYKMSQGEDLKAFIPYSMMNVGLAIENICLRAVSMGLGTCIIRRMEPKKIAEYLKLPENTVVLALVAAGVPDEDPKPRPRLPLEELLLEIPKE